MQKKTAEDEQFSQSSLDCRPDKPTDELTHDSLRLVAAESNEAEPPLADGSGALPAENSTLRAEISELDPTFESADSDQPASSSDHGTTSSTGSSNGGNGNQVYDSYKEELLLHSIESTIESLTAQGKKKSAELGSRLLMDVSEKRISLHEAADILQMLNAQVPEPKNERKDVDTQPSNTVRTMLVACLTVCTMLVGGAGALVLIAGMHPQHRRHMPNYGTTWEYKHFPLEEESKLHSANGYFQSDFTLTDLRNEPIYVFWLNYRGQRVLYTTLKPGQAFNQPTYASHPWVVTDPNGKAIDLFVVGRTPHENIEVK